MAMKAHCTSLAGALHSALDTLQQQWARISRVVVAAGVPAAILFFGHGYSSPDSIWHSTAFVSFVQWFVVTSVVVALPTVGKTTQKAIERTLGSLCGGALGLMFVATEAPWAKVIGVLIVTTLGEFVSIHFKKDYTGRLMSMTYLIVVAPSWEGSAHPWLAAVLRMTSVIAGIAWTFLVSLLWFPETSSHVVYQQLLVMMQHVEHLGSDTWALIEQQQQLLMMQQQQNAKEQQQPPPKDVSADALSSIDSEGANGGIYCSGSSKATPPAAASSAAAGAEDCGDSEAAPGDVCIHMQDANAPNTEQPTSAHEVLSCITQSQQPQQLSSVQQHLESDTCDDDVRDFIAARAVLQDALKAADAERHVGWLCGRPIIVPSILLPCNTSAGCCCLGPGPKASRDRVTDSHNASCRSVTDAGKDTAHPPSTSGSSQQGGVCGLPPFLPSQQVRLVAISQRHCSHVLWMLHKLLQDGFDEKALLAVHRKYPGDMLSSIQHDAQAVLQVATSLLQSAIQQHHHWHLRRDDGSAAALLKQQLHQLRANMDSLHGHLLHWQEIFLTISKLRREVVQQMLHDHGHVRLSDTASTATVSAVLPSIHQPAGAPAPQTPAAGSQPAAAAAAATAVPGLPALVQQHGVEATGHHDGVALMQQVPELFFITPNARESYLFVLQWHALYYVLQQLDSTFTQLTQSLEELLSAMHGRRLTDI